MGYDIDGRCTTCKEFHPCACEYDNGSEQGDEMEIAFEHRLEQYLLELDERD